MKITNLVAVAAIGLTASTAWAQSHPTAGAPQTTATVNGIFVPAPATALVGVRGGGGVTVSAPPSTPVSVPTTPSTAAAAVVAAGAPAAVANFTQSLQTAGVPSAAAQGVATALQTLGSSPTVASVAAAVTAWNNTLATMTPMQVRALVLSPQGFAAMRILVEAYIAAGRAR